MLKYIAAVSLIVAAWTPSALAGDLEDTISARANARAGGAVSERDKELLQRYGCESGTPSCENGQRAKHTAQPRSYDTERALNAKAEQRARARAQAQAQAAAAARAKVKSAQPNDSASAPIKPAIATEPAAAPKEDLQKTTGVTKSPSAPSQDAPAPETCRRYSPVVGGMVDVPC